MESNFGKDKGSMSVIRSLATLAYSGRRKKYANEQLIAAFKILKSGIVTAENFDGSWAAAMGHTQFIPTSYISYAVDWTGDGKKDIWNTREDALASTANYLAKAGWKLDRPWGWEVIAAQGLQHGADRPFALEDGRRVAEARHQARRWRASSARPMPMPS